MQEGAVATSDPVTGACSRVHLQPRMEQELARATRAGKSFAVFLFDVDYFKTVNDVYGHDVGDTRERGCGNGSVGSQPHGVERGLEDLATRQAVDVLRREELVCIGDVTPPGRLGFLSHGAEDRRRTASVGKPLKRDGTGRPSAPSPCRRRARSSSIPRGVGPGSARSGTVAQMTFPEGGAAFSPTR